MEIGQNAREHSSGSEISNWTTFPGKRLSSVLAEIPLLLVQKKKKKKKKKKKRGNTKGKIDLGEPKEVKAYDLYNI